MDLLYGPAQAAKDRHRKHTLEDQSEPTTMAKRGKQSPDKSNSVSQDDHSIMNATTANAPPKGGDDDDDDTSELTDVTEAGSDSYDEFDFGTHDSIAHARNNPTSGTSNSQALQQAAQQALDQLTHSLLGPEAATRVTTASRAASQAEETRFLPSEKDWDEKQVASFALGRTILSSFPKFKHLAPELRNKVYRHIVGTDKLCRLYHEQGNLLHLCKPDLTTAVKLCKYELEGEALSVFYRENKFVAEMECDTKSPNANKLHLALTQLSDVVSDLRELDIVCFGCDTPTLWALAQIASLPLKVNVLSPKKWEAIPQSDHQLYAAMDTEWAEPMVKVNFLPRARTGRFVTDLTKASIRVLFPALLGLGREHVAKGTPSSADMRKAVFRFLQKVVPGDQRQADLENAKSLIGSFTANMDFSMDVEQAYAADARPHLPRRGHVRYVEPKIHAPWE